MSVNLLAELSRFYGGNPEYILAGGGNTSWKNEDTLYVKGSGFSLAEASDESFVKMDRKALVSILEKSYPSSSAERESAVLADMMAARKAGEGQKRPSVEALLHDIIPFSYVVHLHPALINGLTCSVNGEEAVREMFGGEVIWIPSINPGFILSKSVKKEIDEFYLKKNKHAEIIFLQNHGVFAGAHSVDRVKELYSGIMSKIESRIKRKPDFSDELRITKETSDGFLQERAPAKNQISLCIDIMNVITELAGFSAFLQSSEFFSFIDDRKSFYPVSSAFTPDHIVYAGSDPLFIEAKTAEGIREAWKDHGEKTGRNPKITAVRGLGVFSAEKNEKAAGFALDLFKDAVKIAVYSQNFGGPLFMTADKIDFINNWEVERFRSAVSTK